MRLFVGLAIPEEYSRTIGEVQGEWRRRLRSRVSWVRPELAHVTLKFLGETDVARVKDIARAMRAAAAGSFAMQGGSGGFFPSRGAPRVVWLGFADGAAECGKYFVGLDRELEKAGFAPETRPFAPHVTVARVKEAVRGDDWAGLAAALTRDWSAFRVDRAVLWQSVLLASGPQYRPLEEISLAG